jgi:hypothetical protein
MPERPLSYSLGDYRGYQKDNNDSKDSNDGNIIKVVLYFPAVVIAVVVVLLLSHVRGDING